MRNAALTSIAPTGTLSLLAGCSSGIEPVFSFVHSRRNTIGKTFVIVNPVFLKSLEKTLAAMGLKQDERKKRLDDIITHVHEHGTVQDILWLPNEFRALFKSALDIHWKDHILMQAAFQKYVHASISKTINLPGSATKEDCEDALLMAWELKLKGITLYRTGSRHNVVLFLNDSQKDAEDEKLKMSVPPR
jgi:ribonucleoside-diphosphate reductase alpha chain